MSVAIPIPLLQNLPDVNVTPGVGVDEYALTYDHDTARFVLRAPADLSGYALLAGRAGGQTLYGGTAANDDITIHGTSDGTRTSSYVLLQPSGGNVGINTATPTRALDVAGSIVAEGGYSSFAGVNIGNNASVGNGFYGYSDGSDYGIRSGGRITLASTSGATPYITIWGGGYIGIGIADYPSSLLDIGAGALTMTEMAAPTGVANKAILYTKDSGGKTALCCKLGGDVEIVLATQA